MTAAPIVPVTLSSEPAPRSALKWRKYVAAALLALRLRLQDPNVLLGRSLFYVLILVIFSRLWQALLAGTPDANRAGELVWYVAVTEFVTLSQPHFFMEIERDVRTGDIAYHLTRPISYLTLKLSGGLASMLLGMAFLLIPGILTSWLLTGVAPHAGSSIALCAPVALLAGSFLLLCNALIGLSAFWLQDCAPAYWVWQKMLFVLGGLFVPLDLYPAWLREVAALSPFGAALYGPAQLLFHHDLSRFWGLCAQLVLWNGVCAALIAFMYRKALRVIDLHGG